jgi:hypothetical protein
MGTASWYQDFANGYQWSYRAAITVDVGSNTGARDVSISIPATWDYFWETVRSAGQDVRITAADGVTLIPFDIDTFSATNRTGTIEIDGYTVPGTGARVYLLWIYWGQAACSTAITPLSISGADTGYIELGRPSTRLVSNPIQRPGDTVARERTSKGTAESVFVWLDSGPLLGPRREPYAESVNYEAVSYATVDVQTGGSTVGGMASVPSVRFVEYRDSVWIRQTVSAGVDDTDYTALWTITTTLGQVLTGRSVVQVRNVSEA